METKLILFATYWNEIEWIECSLAQIDIIDPDEIIICDGCFDPRLPNKSTDGTREVIEKFVAKRPKARMISALRLNKFQHAINWMQKLPHEKGMLSWAKIRGIKASFVNNVYRLNQAATFNHMIELSESFIPGNWMMTYDCDQFYEDKMLQVFKNLSKVQHANIIVGKELTFFDDFSQYTDDYETRDYNNMPHRIFGDTRFIPTRHISKPWNGKYTNCSDFETLKLNAGHMFHYHVKSPERIKAGYSLGDRKPPESKRTATEVFKGDHPSVIKEYFSENL